MGHYSRHSWTARLGLAPTATGQRIWAGDRRAAKPMLLDLTELAEWQRRQDAARATYHGDSIHARQRINGRWSRDRKAAAS